MAKTHERHYLQSNEYKTASVNAFYIQANIKTQFHRETILKKLEKRLCERTRDFTPPCSSFLSARRIVSSMLSSLGYKMDEVWLINYHLKSDFRREELKSRNEEIGDSSFCIFCCSSNVGRRLRLRGEKTLPWVRKTICTIKSKEVITSLDSTNQVNLVIISV